VRGAAQVVRSLRDPVASAPGRVLVLPALLPSWAPELLGAVALVTDTGGALCHGATLAREAGIPAVVGTGQATAIISDGDELVVDAGRGVVYFAAAGPAQTGSVEGAVNGR
jgi:pyruvate,water dikinase